MTSVRLGRAVAAKMKAQFVLHASPAVAKHQMGYLRAGLQEGQLCLGLAAPARRAVMTSVLNEPPRILLPTTDDGDELYAEKSIKSAMQQSADACHAAVQSLWHSNERENQASALDIIRQFKQHYCHADTLPMLDAIIHECHWWDTLDIAATNVSVVMYEQRRVCASGKAEEGNPQWAAVAGKTLAELRAEHESILIRWRGDSSLWVRRASLLAHLQHDHDVSFNVLEETIDLLASEEDFFIRKAIGWVLRQIAHSDPDYTFKFVQSRSATLSKLSVKEALKNIGGVDALEKGLPPKSKLRIKKSAKRRLEEAPLDQPKTSKRARR